MLAPDFVIHNIDLWNEDKIQKNVDVYVASGVVAKIEKSQAQTNPNATVFEGMGKVLLPSGVDNQVHIRVPGQAHKESPKYAAQAALQGGYGALLAMPNTYPTVDTPERLQRCYEEWQPAFENYGVELLQSSALSESLASRVNVDFEAMIRAGAKAFTDDGVSLVNDALMEEAFAAAAKWNFVILQHAEWPGHGGSLAACEVQKKSGLKAYPQEAESRIVARDLSLLRKHPKARYHVLHVTTQESVELIRQAQKEGLRVTGEVSPHHLFYCADDIVDGKYSFKMNPPLFRSQDRSVLREALREGVLSFVATDHAPHEEFSKSQGWAKAPFGTTGLETSLRVLFELLNQKILKSPSHLVEVFSSAPARFLGLDDYGHIAVGKPLKAVLCDPEAPPAPIKESDLASLSHNNVFLGVALPGKLLGHFNSKGFFRFQLH